MINCYVDGLMRFQLLGSLSNDFFVPQGAIEYYWQGESSLYKHMQETFVSKNCILE